MDDARQADVRRLEMLESDLWMLQTQKFVFYAYTEGWDRAPCRVTLPASCVDISAACAEIRQCIDEVRRRLNDDE